MSPVPGPLPLRHRLTRLLFSPAGLLCGFVFLLIATCPGARGEDASGILSANFGTFAFASDVNVPPVSAAAKAVTSKPFGRSTRFDRERMSSARVAAPVDRVATKDALPHTRKVVPLLIDPSLTDSPRMPAPGPTPMTGQPVGVSRTSLRPRTPSERAAR
ncbi:MAG: hypothetical protein ACKON8_09420 [Planctomycetota bacterium]